MTISKSIQRPLATSTETKTLTISSAITEVNGNLNVDINLNVTKSDSTIVVKTLFRVIVPITILPATATSPTTINIDSLIYAFAGAGLTYSAGGLIPDISTGSFGVKTISIDDFLTAAGNARA